MKQFNVQIYHDYCVPLLDSNRVRDTILEYLTSHVDTTARSIDCEVRFVDSATIRHLNNTYRNKDASTDVLSFPLWEHMGTVPHGAPLHLGSIVINGETITDGSKKNHRSVNMHACALAKHSIRHLIGRHHRE